MGRTSRAVIRGSRLFNAILAFLALERISRGLLVTRQSGSPPGGLSPIRHLPDRYLITPVSVRRFFAQAASLCPESAGISIPKLTVWIREPDTPSEIR